MPKMEYVTVEELAAMLTQTVELIGKYDNAAKRVIESWESGDLAQAVRELERVYRRES